jgi:hypothetical protein
LLFQAKQYDEALARIQLARSQFKESGQKTAPDKFIEATALIEKIETLQKKSKKTQRKSVD